MIMNRKNPIYGTVTNPNVSETYEGLTTDSATVTVNNVDRTIAVDVDFRSMLGETADKAYPGHLGSQNRSLAVRAIEASEQQDKKLQNVENKIRRELYTEIREVDTAVAAIHDELDKETHRAINAESSLSSAIDNIEENYADKLYVQQKLTEYTKLSKQIVDSVSVEENTVVIKGVTSSPVDGVLYLVKDSSQTGEDTYKQYTTIDGKLTLIGDTKIDLSDYATQEYVDNQIEAIPEVDLSPYALKTDIPDVSEFLSAIPEEYITDVELTNVLDDYTTKSYVAAEIAKVGTLAKKVVDAVDLVNNTILVEGVLQPAEPDVIYLVSEDTDGVYQQYTLIDNQLTFIGDTNVDLKGYATEVYVDDKIEQTVNYVDNNIKNTTNYVDTKVSSTYETILNIIQSIKFIDGGTSTSSGII